MAFELIFGGEGTDSPVPHLDTTWAPLEPGAERGLSVITLVIDLKFTGRRVGQFLQVRDPVSL